MKILISFYFLLFLKFITSQENLQLDQECLLSKSKEEEGDSNNNNNNNKVFVALESTVISHGLPYPQNIELALKMESIVKEIGGEPKTCGIIQGKLIAGLTKDQIEYLATSSINGRYIHKVSRKDIPYIVARKLDGATTVASTMIIAEMNNIEIFATGGIGGVHRGWDKTFDISADLEELSNSKVIVICSGAKAILDIPATFEYLETKGVTIIGYQTDYIPAFYSRQTSQRLKVDIRCDTPKEIIDIWNAKKQLNLKGGLLVLNPIPEEYEIPFNIIEPKINEALIHAQNNNIHGSKVTPYLLSYLNNITESKSVIANLALLENNAKLAAHLAVELGKQRN